MAGTWVGTTYNGDDTGETVTGTAAAEQIWGFLGNDVIRGNGGADTIDGGLESDKIFGGAGDDIIFDLNSYSSGFAGLIGKDTIFGGAGDDQIWFNSVDSSDIGDGGAGLDTLVIRFDFLGASTLLPVEFALGPTTACYVDGILGLTALNFERVDVAASNGNDILTGGALDDTLRGLAGDDFLSGLGGDDRIEKGQGNFNLFGGADTDTLVLDLSHDFNAFNLKLDGHFTVSTAATVGTADGFEIFAITTGDLDDRLTGDALNDSLNGGNGADVLFGASGNDLLTLGLGAGKAYGGDGNDTIANSNPFFTVTPDAGDFADGGAGDDRIEFALGGNNKGMGGLGNDSITVRYDNTTYGTVNTLFGGDGNDSLSGANGADHVFGGAGNDVLGGFTRVQEMRGGTGNDVLTVNGSATDPVAVGQVLDGGTGFDRLNWAGQIGGVVDLTTGAYTTSQGTQVLGFEAFGLYVGYLSNTSITFGAGDDRLEGSGGAFTLTVDAGAGNDSIVARTTTTATLIGGSGNDHLASYYGTGSGMAGGSGNDVLSIYSLGSCTLNGGADADVVYFYQSVVADLTLGTAVRSGGTDTLIGIEGLTGSYGNDTLIGNAGNNQLFGGNGGSDLVTTGAGADTVITYRFQSGITHVTDFSHANDSIGIAGLNFGTLALPNGPLDAARLVFVSFATAPTATISGPQFFYDSSSGNLWQDSDGIGGVAAVLVLVLDNHALIDASDLIVGDYVFF